MTLTVGRNDPCPCESGKKFKKCCLDHEPAPPRPTFDLTDPAVAARLRKMDRVQEALGLNRQAAQALAVGKIHGEAPGTIKETGSDRPIQDPAATLRQTLMPSVLAREGVRGLGVGSNRVAVEFDDELVAKLSWSPAGLALNLFDAAVWLALPDTAVRNVVPMVALTVGGALIARYATPVIEPITPEEQITRMVKHRAYEAEVRGAFRRHDLQAMRQLEVPPEYEPNPWEREIHALRRRIGESKNRDPRFDNYGVYEGRLVSFEPRPAGLATVLRTTGEWLKERLADRDLALDRQALRPALRDSRPLTTGS